MFVSQTLNGRWFSKQLNASENFRTFYLFIKLVSMIWYNISIKPTPNIEVDII